MRELSKSESEIISGGEMSTRTAVILGITIAVSPGLAAMMALGYYANSVNKSEC